MTSPQGELDEPPAIDPTDLLRHARAVAGSLPGRTEADYRRAVSAAYYALFHAVTLQAARVIAAPERPAHWDALTGRFTHRHARLVATWVAGGLPAERFASRVAGLEFDEQVQTIATAFQQLVREREEADYRHSSVFTQERAFEAIDIASEAVDVVLSLAPPRESWLAFLKLLADVEEAQRAGAGHTGD